MKPTRGLKIHQSSCKNNLFDKNRIRKIAPPQKIAPQKIAPQKITPQKIGPQKISPYENTPPLNIPPYESSPLRKLPPRNLAPRKLPPGKITPNEIPSSLINHTDESKNKVTKFFALKKAVQYNILIKITKVLFDTHMISQKILGLDTFFTE